MATERVLAIRAGGAGAGLGGVGPAAATAAGAVYPSAVQTPLAPALGGTSTVFLEALVEAPDFKTDEATAGAAQQAVLHVRRHLEAAFVMVCPPGVL